jgi:hypothetical protein
MNREHLFAVEALVRNAHELLCGAMEEAADASDFERHKRLFDLAKGLNAELNDARKQMNTKQPKGTA